MLGERADTRRISIHAPPRGATWYISTGRASTEFQFTPLREGRHHNGANVNTSFVFQFTPLREGRHWQTLRHRPGAAISIHAPPRGATVHGVCWGYWNLISIHAPPRGATRYVMVSQWVENISIHAPPRGATVFVRALVAQARYFNSRPSARGDAKNEVLATGKIFQFTPLREGRPGYPASTAQPMAFQFTPLREGRPIPYRLQYSALAFQFTPLREGRHR